MRIVSQPVIPYDYPDPDVIRVNDTYYMVTTTMHFFPGAEILRSKNLLDWEHQTYVFSTLDETNAQQLMGGEAIYGQGMWAASLRYHEGYFYVLFSANDTRKTYLFVSKAINGPWEKRIVEGFYHDPSLLFEDNRAYIAYGNSTIHLLELNESLTAPKSDGLSRVLVSEEHPILGYEGAHLQYINGFYYLFLIHSLPTTWRRVQACFRSSSLTGPFEGGDCFNHDRGYLNQGVAQGGLVDTVDGSWYAYLFQDMGAVGRLPIFVPVTFQNDWPVFGVEGDIPATFETSNVAVQPLVTDDDFKEVWATPFGFKPQWQFNHVPRCDYIKHDHDNGEITLKSTGPTTFLSAPNMLTVRTAFPRSIGEITVIGHDLAIGDVCGLGILQGAYRYVGLERESDGVALKSVVFREGKEVVTESVPLASSVVTLKAEVVTENMADYVQFFYRDGHTFIPIGFKEPLTFSLDHFTGARFALFLFSQDMAGGQATFKVFKYVKG
nr:glycoside hydrolase 43 family protein [Halolactibacillus sp. JCM 19043]